MVQGGATNPTYSGQFIENIVEYIKKKQDLVSKLKDLLKEKGLPKEGTNFNDLTVEHLSELLKKMKIFQGAIKIVQKYFEQDKVSLEAFLEQISKVEDMEEKLETLGNRLLI